MKNPLNSDYHGKVKHRHGQDINALFGYSSNSKQIPFYFEVKLPPPLRRGVDYGFKKLSVI